MCFLRRITHKLGKAEGLYVKFVSDSPNLHIDKIHKNDNSIPTLPSKSHFLTTLLYILGSGGRKIVPRFILMEFIEV